MDKGGGGSKGPGAGAKRAAAQAMGGAGGIADRPPAPGALASAATAARSVAQDLASATPASSPGPGALRVASTAPVQHLTDEQALGRIARAGLRSMGRKYPESGTVVTPLGPAQAYKVRERNTQGQGVDYIHTVDTHYPGSTGEPKTYPDMAKHMTPVSAAAALGRPVDTSGESGDALRASATARALGDVSENQRNGAAKHARAALRTVASEALSPRDVYGTGTPAFPQARRPGGMQYHRDVMAESMPMTSGQRTVVEHFSDSSDDEHGGPRPSDREAIARYRMRTETKAVRATMGAEVVSAGIAGRRRERSPAIGAELDRPMPSGSVATRGPDSVIRRRVESDVPHGTGAKGDVSGKK